MDPAVINEVAKDYSNFLKIDISKDATSVEQIIDDTLTRLEEFQSVIEMVREEGGAEQVENILAKRGEFNTICDRVLKLEAFVARVRQDVDAIETLVINAETDTSSNEGTIGKLLKPFLFKKKESPGSSRRPYLPPYEPPEIFKTSDYFPSPENS